MGRGEYGRFEEVEQSTLDCVMDGEEFQMKVVSNRRGEGREKRKERGESGEIT